MIQTLGLLAPVAQGVVSIFKGREERRNIKAQAEGALAQAKQEGRDRIELSRAEWESMAIQSTNNSFKDELVTIVMVSPIIGILAGAVWSAFTHDDRLLDGVIRGLEALAKHGVDMGDLMMIVVLAAVGIKAWRLR